MRVLIAEDEPLAARRMVIELSRRGDLELIGPVGNGIDARKVMLEQKPDIALLDIRMPGSTGLEVLEGLQPEQTPIVIFTTAYHHYAVSAFKAGAIDYLMKPIESDALDNALDRARVRLREQNAEERSRELRALVSQLRSDKQTDHEYETAFWVKNAKQNVRVSVHDVEAIEAVRDYVLMHTHGRSHLMRAKISDIESRLDPAQFMRVHRSFIINQNFLRAFGATKTGSKSITLTSGRVIPVGRTYSSVVAQKL